MRSSPTAPAPERPSSIGFLALVDAGPRRSAAAVLHPLRLPRCPLFGPRPGVRGGAGPAFQTADLLDRHSLIVDGGYQIRDEIQSFPTERSHQFAGTPGFHLDRQVSHRVRRPIACRLHAYLSGCLLNGHGHRTDRRTLSCGLAARQIHRPGSGKVRQGLSAKAKPQPSPTTHKVHGSSFIPGAVQQRCHGKVARWARKRCNRIVRLHRIHVTGTRCRRRTDNCRKSAN